MPDPHRPFPVSSLAAPVKNAVVPQTGPRKLIRPTLPPSALAGHRHSLFHNGSETLTARSNRSAAFSEDSHAEAFYFQKQMQAQTVMVVVLENGEHIEGTLEWYDHNAIKLRNGQRRHTMIYKSGIKYLYKAAEKAPRDTIK